MFKRYNPESKKHLLELQPRGTFSFEEVQLFMHMMLNVVVNGMLVKSWEVVDEKEYWWKVEITYDRYFDRRDDEYDTWYFFKKHPAADVTSQNG